MLLPRELTGFCRGVGSSWSGDLLIVLPVPAGVLHVAISNAFYHLIGLFRVHRFHALCGYPGVDGTGLDDGVLEDDAAGGDDGVFAHHGVVHDDGAHADQGVGFDACAVDDHVVTDGDVVADLHHRFVVKGVQHAAVLDVHLVADADRVHIAPQDGVEPDGTLVAHLHVADDGGGFRQVTIRPHFRGEAPYRFDQCHSLLFVTFLTVLTVGWLNCLFFAGSGWFVFVFRFPGWFVFPFKVPGRFVFLFRFPWRIIFPVPERLPLVCDVCFQSGVGNGL